MVLQSVRSTTTGVLNSHTRQSFESRLHWCSHFIQKLESEPRIAFESLVPTFDDLHREHDAEAYERWCLGPTGFPLVDACMRALAQTGYLNFRMRAMIVSFAAHDLGLDWRYFHNHLARQWLDYEPGIHLCQVQMQSGATGNRTLRIYDPTKQALKFDHEGLFIRRWIPELRAVPLVYLHQPWLHPKPQVATYPRPIVDHRTATQASRERIAKIRKWTETEAWIRHVRAVHNDSPRSASKRQHQIPLQQLRLDL